MGDKIKTGMAIRVERDGQYVNIDCMDATPHEFYNYLIAPGTPPNLGATWALHLQQWIAANHDFEKPPVGLGMLISRYYKFRDLLIPSKEQAFMFLVSEVGELADAIVSGDGKWVRNNPGRERDIDGEAADVLMMLYVTMMHLGIDPYRALRAKMKDKGFIHEEA